MPLKGIPLPPNPAQVPNPIQPHRPKDQLPAEPVHHRQSKSRLSEPAGVRSGL